MYLSINLLAISIKIPLKSLSPFSYSISGMLIPIDFISKGCDFNLTNFTPYNVRNIIPIVKKECMADPGFINYLRLHKITGLILVDEALEYPMSNFPIYSITHDDYNFLIKLIESHKIEIKNRSPKQVILGILKGVLSNVTISITGEKESLSVITTIALQFPPLLTLLLIILLLRTFSASRDYDQEYVYDDVRMDTYSMRTSEIITVCSICFDEFANDSEIRILECEHVYHKECIGAWLNRSHICPLCRKDIHRGSLLTYSDIVYI